VAGLDAALDRFLARVEPGSDPTPAQALQLKALRERFSNLRRSSSDPRMTHCEAKLHAAAVALDETPPDAEDDFEARVEAKGTANRYDTLL